MKTTRLKDDECPACKTKLSAASSNRGQVPEPGDLSVCIDCGAWMVFREDMSLKLAEESDVKDLSQEQFDTMQDVTSRLMASKHG